MSNPCLIFGNGPSLNRMPLNMLTEMPTFGMNYAPHQPNYYVCVDTDVLLRPTDEVRRLVKGSQAAFLSKFHAGKSDLYQGENVVLVDKDTRSFKAEQFMSGFTAAYVALKYAYYMGFDQVHLYGIDHSADWAHYRKDYPPGEPDRARRMAVMEIHYQLAANVYARAGREIFNHSNPSKLDKIFRRA